MLPLSEPRGRSVMGSTWRTRGWVAGFVSACTLGVLAAPAVAAVSSSNVASPGNGYLIDQGQPVTVSGTTNSRSSSDRVDLNCYAGQTFETLADGVSVQADGSFSWSGPLTPIDDQTCVLRAVPTGSGADYPPGRPAPYSGPTLGLGKLVNLDVNGGPNAGRLAYYDLFDSQLLGNFHYQSLGGCAILDSQVYDPQSFQSAPLDFCNGGFWWRDGYPARPGFLAPTRSELQVDGADGYLAGQLTNMGSFATDNPGFPSLTYGYSLDPATGNLTLDETDQVVECAPAAASFPPTTTSCSEFVPTGIQVKLRIVQGQNGRVASVTQYFSSTDGASHTVDLQEDNEFSHPAHDGQLNFPWTGAGLQAYATPGQVIGGPPSGSGPGSLFIKGSAAAPDGSEASAQGAVTFSNPPDNEQIIGTTNNSSGFSWVDLHYARSVPANGSVALGFTYSNAFLAGDVAGAASAAQAAFHPSVSIASPASGAVTGQPTAVVSGRAGDANQLTSLTVDGVAQSVSNGAWSTTVALNRGANTITAVATNVFGNTSEAQTTITYSPPPVTRPAPALSSVSQSHRTWREYGSRGKAPVGTTIRLTLNLPARVTFTFLQPAAGRRVHGRCVAETRRNRHRPHCTHPLSRGSLSFSAKAGHSLVKFFGPLNRHKALRPGTYTLVIGATDPTTGRRAATKRLTFTIVR
jgi:Glucodextranase, domain B